MKFRCSSNSHTSVLLTLLPSILSFVLSHVFPNPVTMASPPPHHTPNAGLTGMTPSVDLAAAIGSTFQQLMLGSAKKGKPSVEAQDLNPKFAPRDRNLCGLQLLAVKDFRNPSVKSEDPTTTICGAEIGNSGKICIHRNCNVRAHLGAVSEVVQGWQKDNVVGVLCIEKPGRGGSIFGGAVIKLGHVDPSLLTPLLDEHRSLAEWLSVFSVLAEHIRDGEIPARVDFEKRVTALGAPTPNKRFSTEERVFIDTPVLKRLPDSAGMVETLLDSNQQTLHTLALDLKDAVTLLSEEHSLFAKMVADKVNNLGALIGRVPADPIAPALWPVAEILNQSFDQLTLDLQRTKAELTAAFQQSDTALEERCLQSVSAIQPAVVQSLATTVVPTIQALESRISQLETQLTIQSSLGAPPPFPVPVGGGVSVDEFQTLQVRIADLEGRSDERAVQIGDTWITSKARLATWFKDNAGPNASLGAGLFCLDGLSLLTLCSREDITYHDHLDAEQLGKKVSLPDPLRQRVWDSYTLSVPECMGGTKSQADLKPHELCRLPKITDFRGNGSPTDGAANRWKSALESFGRSLRGLLNNHGLSGPVFDLVWTLYRQSYDFLHSLFRFMDDQYSAYGASTELTSKDRWGLVQKLVRIIFNRISRVRRNVEEIPAADAMARHLDFMWACLQAHLIMRDFTEVGFLGLPRSFGLFA